MKNIISGLTFREDTHTYLLTYLLTPRCRVLLEKLTGLQLVKKFPAFYGSLPQSQVTATCHYPVPARSIPHPQIPLPEDPSLYCLPSTPGSPQWSLSNRFPQQNPVYASPLPHTSYMPHPSHSSRFYHPQNIR